MRERTNAFDQLTEGERDQGGHAEQADNQILELVNHHLPQRRRLLLLQLVRAVLLQTTLRLGRGQTLLTATIGNQIDVFGESTEGFESKVKQKSHLKLSNAKSN